MLLFPDILFKDCPCNPKFVGAYITRSDIDFWVRLNGEDGCTETEEVCLLIDEDEHCSAVSHERSQIISTKITNLKEDSNIILYIPRHNCNSDCLVLNVEETSEYNYTFPTITTGILNLSEPSIIFNCTLNTDSYKPKL